MTLAEPAQQPSTERTIGLRTRSDLIIQQSVFQSELCWIVKDPLAMKYFRLRDPEYQILRRLTNEISYLELKTQLQREFPDISISVNTVQQLISSFHQNGLLISNAQGQALPLRKRRQQELRRKALQTLSSLLAIRFPGFDPERFLSWLYPKCRFFFSVWFTCLVVFSCIAALVLIGTNFEHFCAKLPNVQRFFAFDNLIFMGCLLIFTKTIHELGHGLMCKHFGGECHQIGFMMMLFSPAMYCDTSDSWILASRWKRMAIGGAGMYVELFMAAVCCFVWWMTHPSWLHYLALNIMFLSSVSTVVFNANPLLRYDGYYILSDWLELPNLAQKANAAFISKLRVFCLGMKPLSSSIVPKHGQNALAVFSIASFVYRWIVTLGMLWFLRHALQPYGLATIAYSILVASICSQVFFPLIKLIRFFRVPGRSREMNRNRSVLTTLAAACLLVFVCFVPLPHYVWASFFVRPQDGQQLVLPQGGQLREIFFRDGDLVQPGETIAILRNDDLSIELEELQGQLARLYSDRAALEFESVSTMTSARKLAETVAEIQSVQRRIETKRLQIDQLTVRAQQKGYLYAPRNTLLPDSADDALPSWSGTPLDRENSDAYLEANTMLGTIGRPDCVEAILVVDQTDIQLIRPGQRVIALANQYRTAFIDTEVIRVSQDEMVHVPRELSQTNRGPIPVQPLADGNEQPLFKAYEAYASFSPDTLARAKVQLLPGMSGYAKIYVGTSTLLSRLRRYLQTVINIQ